MKEIKIIVISVLLCMAGNTMAQKGQNTPYVDDRLVHFGFSLGIDFGGYSVRETGSYLHARTSDIIPGFAVGFISDLRLSRHLNLRFCPSLHYAQRIINFDDKTEANDPVIPLDIPLYLKFSADREANYRPYIIAGGGLSMNLYSQKQKELVATKFLDYFFEVGFGVDSYFRWFKFCPEIKYHIGFNNQKGDPEGLITSNQQDMKYMNCISGLFNHVISLTFNFE